MQASRHAGKRTTLAWAMVLKELDVTLGKCCGPNITQLLIGLTYLTTVCLDINFPRPTLRI